MEPIADDIDGLGPPAGPDPLRHLVQIALIVYLTPVIAIVCAIGGASVLFEKASRVAARLATKASRVEPIAPRPNARIRKSIAVGRRTRAGF